MYSQAKQRLECNHCRMPLSPLELLWQTDSCSPQLSILHSTCVRCQARLQVQPQPERLSVGGIDGFPGPCFIVESTELVPGLSVRRDEHHFLVTYGDNVFDIPEFKLPRELTACHRIGTDGGMWRALRSWWPF